MATPPSGGTDIVALGISVDTTQPAEAAGALDKLGTATVKVVKNLDDLSNATEKNSKWVSDATQKYQNQIQVLEAAWKAEQSMLNAEKDVDKIRRAAVGTSSELIAKLEQLISVYGLTREQVMRLNAEQLNMSAAAEPLIAKLEALKAATARYGAGITDLASIEEKERSAAISLNAQRIRSINEQAAAEESARTSLNAQRIRAISEQKAAEESAATSLQAFRRRTMGENRVAAIAEIEAMEAARLSGLERERSREAVFSAFKKRTIAENQAEAIRKAKEHEEAAVKLAEKQALEEIKWAQTSTRAKIAELERLKAYQANTAVRPETINSSFSGAALRDLANLQKYHDEVAKSAGVHGRAKAGVSSFSDSVKNLGWNARASTELLVLAHEAVEGRFKRMPGSLMVLGEFTGAASLAFSKLGLAILGVGAAFVTLSYAIVKGILEQKAMNDALIFSGNYAGQTAESLLGVARAAADMSGSIGVAKEAVIALAESGRFTSDQFALVTEAVVAWEHATGRGVNNIVKEFESLAVQATGHTKRASEQVSINLMKLNDTYHFTTQAVYEQIRVLELEGKQREASTLALATYAEEAQRRSTESANNLGKIEKAWKAIKHATGEAIDSMMSWGKTAGPMEKLAQAQADQAKAQAELDRLNNGGKDRLSASREALAQEALAKANASVVAASKELLGVQERLYEQGERARTQADAIHASQAIFMQQQQLQRKSMGELNWTLKEYEERIKVIKEGNPDSILVSDEAVADMIAAITKAHTQTVKIVRDGRKQQLSAQMEGATAEYNLTKQATETNERLLSEAYRAGVVMSDSYYSALREGRADELRAVDREYITKIKFLADFKAKGNDEKEEVKRRLQEITNAHELAAQRIKDATVQDELKQTSAKKKIEDDSDNSIGKFLSDLLKEAEALENANLARERSKSVIEQEALARTNNAIAALQENRARQILNGASEDEIKQTEKLILYLEQVAKLRGRIVAAQIKKDENKGFDDMFKDMEKDAKKLENVLSSSFGNIGKSIGKAVRALMEYRKTQNEIEKDYKKEHANAAGDQKKEIKALEKMQKDSAEAQVKSYGDMAGAAKGFVSEKTAAYRILSMTEQGFRALQLMLSISAMVMDNTETANSVKNATVKTATSTTAGVAKAFEQMGVWGFVGAAAILAFMAAIGAKGSGGGSGVSVSQQRQEKNGTGTVFGDETEKSESLANSIDLLADNSDIALKHTSGMLSALKNIEANIGGLANLVVQASGLRGTKQDVDALNLKTPSGVLSSLFGGKTQTLLDSGISVSNQNLGQALNEGIAARTYSEIQSVRKFLGITISTKKETRYGELEQELKDQFTRVLADMVTGVATAAEGLGRSGATVRETLNSMDISLSEISFKDLSGEEIQEELQALFSSIGDNMASLGLRGLGVESFQKVGEGLLETTIRVSSGIEIAQYALEQLGIAAVDYTAITQKQGDVAVEMIRDSLLAVEAGSGVAEMIRTLTGTADDLISAYADLNEVRDLLNSAGLNGTNLSRDTVRGAGGLDPLKSGLETYSEEFFTDAERHAFALSRLTIEFAKLGRALPDSREGFRALVTSVDDGTEAGDRLVGKLLTLSEAFADVMDSADDTAESIRDSARAAADVKMENLEAAFTQLQRSVEAVRKRAIEDYNETVKNFNNGIKDVNASIGALNRLAGSLRSTIERMRLPVEFGADRTAAQAQIITALAIARAGGVLPKIEDLQSALNVVSQPSEQLFSTFLDYQRDFIITRNNITGLATLTDVQLTVEEQTLTTLNAQLEAAQAAHEAEMGSLDAILETARNEIDILNGIRVGVLAIPEALARFNSALGVAKADPILGSTGAISGAYNQYLHRDPEERGLTYWQDQAATGTSVDDIVWNIANSNESKIQQLYGSILGRVGEAAGVDYWTQKLEQGVSVAAIENEFYHSDEYLSKLPSLDIGTNSLPADMPIMAHAGERIIPPADNRELMSRLSSPAANNAVLIAELRAQRAENKEMKQMLEQHLYAIAKTNLATSEAIEDAVTGKRPLQTEVV